VKQCPRHLDGLERRLARRQAAERASKTIFAAGAIGGRLIGRLEYGNMDEKCDKGLQSHLHDHRQANRRRRKPTSR
jgi:hypothetical protein